MLPIFLLRRRRRVGHPDALYVHANSHAELTSHAPSDSNSSRPPSSARSFASQPQSQNHSPAPLTPTANTSMTPIVLTPVSMANGERPRTPPRRTFRVINESPGSPPPAYHAPAADSAFARLVVQGEKVGIGGLLEAKGGAGAGDEAVVDDEGERKEGKQEEEGDRSQVASTSSLSAGRLWARRVRCPRAKRIWGRIGGWASKRP